MHFTAPLLTLLSVLPLLASATPDAQPASGLVIKQVDLSLRKRQATTTTGGSYVTSWNQCTQVCEGYFGKPAASSTSVPAANNAVVSTSTTKASSVAVASSAASSVKPSTTTSVTSTSRTTSTSTTSTRSTTSVASTTRITSSSAPAAPTSTRASSAAISSARSSSAAPPATTSAASGGGTTTAAQRQLILDLHNAERRDYGASPLTWNTALEQYAYDYASKCQWKHSQGPHGENLAASYGYPDAISQGINGWNAERSQYNPQSPVASHWSQNVWKGTTQVGCALVSCPAGTIQPGWGVTSYLVCEYQAPGNYAGQYGANIGTRVA